MQPQRVIACFDFDGTITTADSLRDFVIFTIGRGRFVSSVVRASPWLIGLLLGVCDRGTTKMRFLKTTVAGMSASELEDKAVQYALHRLPDLIRPEMLVRIEEHRRRGHRLVLVSASPSLYLKHWAANNGFDTVLATELEFREGLVTGSLATPNCWGPQKVLRLQQWFAGSQPQTMYAYGDSRGDREMLALANYGWLRGAGSMPSIDDWPRKTPAA